MRAELHKWRIAQAAHQRDIIVILADIQDIEKHLDEIEKAIMVEYEKIDAALDRDATDRGIGNALRPNT